VRRPNLLEYSLAAALALTLAVKFATGPTVSSVALEVEENFRLVAILEANGFIVEPYLADMNPPMVPAHKPGCRVLAGRASPLGWHRGVLASLVQSDERLFFVFGGQTYNEQPVLRSILAYHVARIRAYFGLPGTDEPVIAVIAEPGCNEAAIRFFVAAANGKPAELVDLGTE
jgi:hypothetical protein